MKWGYILLSYFSLFALSLLDNGRGPAYPDILETFNITTEKGSLIFSLASFASLLVNFSSKWWLSKLGAVLSSRISLVILSISSIGYYFSANLNSFGLMIFSSFILGVGIAITTITMNLLIMRGSLEEFRRRFFSGLHSVYGFTSFLVPYILNAIVDLNLKWEHYFLYISTIPLIIFFFSFKAERSKSNQHSDKVVNPGIKLNERFLVGAFYGLYVSSEILVSSRITYVLEKGLGYSGTESAKYFGLFFILLSIGRLSFGLLPIKLNSMKLLKTSLVLSILCFFLGLNYSVYFLAILGLTMSYFFPVALDYLATKYQRATDYMTTSVMTSIGIYLTLVHWGFGIMAKKMEVLLAFHLVPAFLCTCLGLCFYLEKLNPKFNFEQQ